MVRDPDGRPDFYIATVEDISGTKAAEEALANSNHLLDAIIENLPAVVVVKRASDLRYVRMNRAGEEMLGYPPGYLVGKSNYEIFPKEQADFITSVDRDVLATAEIREISEVPFRMPDGGTRYFRTSKSVLRDAENSATHLVSVSVDITDRKKIEERLRVSEERHRMALEAGRLGTFDWDIANDVVSWDARSRAALGLGETLDFARSVALAHPDDRASVAAAIDRALDPEATEPFVHEWRGLRPDGTTRWTETQGRAYFTGDGPDRRAYRLLGIVRDISRRKRAELALETTTRTACSTASSRTCRRSCS
jgi:PAS domain S-box-containing protein